VAKLEGCKDVLNLRSKVFVTNSESAQEYYQLVVPNGRRMMMQESTQELFDDNFSTAQREKSPEEVQAEQDAQQKKKEGEAKRARWPDLFDGKSKEANNQSIQFKKGMRMELQKLMTDPDVLSNYELKMAELNDARSSSKPPTKDDLKAILGLVAAAQKALDDDIDEKLKDPWGIVSFIVKAYCQGIEPEGGMGLSATIKFFLDYTTPYWITKYETWEGDVVNAIANNAKIEYIKQGGIEEEWVRVEGKDYDDRIATETENAAKANRLQFFFYRLVRDVGNGQGAKSATALLRPIGFLSEVQKNATTFMANMAAAINGCDLFINDPDLRFILGTMRVYLMYSRREDWQEDVSNSRLLDWLEKTTTDNALKKKGREDAGGLSVIDMFVRANDPEELIAICKRIKGITDRMVLVNPTTLLQDIAKQITMSIGTVAAIDVMCDNPENVFPASLPKERWLQCGTTISEVLKQTSDEQKRMLERLKVLYATAANTHGYAQKKDKFKTDFPTFVSDLMDSIITSAEEWKPKRDYLVGQEEEQKLDQERQDRVESPEFYKRLDELNTAAATATAVAAGAQAQASGSSSVGPLAESAAESRDEFLDGQLLKFKEVVSEIRTLLEKNKKELTAENGYPTRVMMTAQNLRTLLSSTLEEKLVEKMTAADMLEMNKTYTKIINDQKTITKAIEVKSNARQSMERLLSKLEAKRVYNANKPAAPYYPGLKEFYENIVRLYKEAEELIADSNYQKLEYKVVEVERELDKVDAEKSKARVKEAAKVERANAVEREKRYLVNIRTMDRYYMQTNQPDLIIKRYCVEDEFEPPTILEERFIQAKEEVAQKEGQDEKERKRRAKEKEDGAALRLIMGRRQPHPDSESESDNGPSDDDELAPPNDGSSEQEDGPVQWFKMNVNTELDISCVGEEDAGEIKKIDRKSTQGAFSGRVATSAEKAVLADELRNISITSAASIASAKAALVGGSVMVAMANRSSGASSSSDAPPPRQTPPRASQRPPPSTPPTPPSNPNPNNLLPPPITPTAPPPPPPPTPPPASRTPPPGVPSLTPPAPRPATRFLGGTPDAVRQQFIRTAKRVRAAMEAKSARAAAKPAPIGVTLAAIEEGEEGEAGEAEQAEQALCNRLHFTVSSAIEEFYDGNAAGLQQLVDGLPAENPTVLDAVVYMLSQE
tara:strand:+ start:211 stop:3732 length:3522 start_codon:yes stop_codon:yes gene_type:complete